MDEDGQIEDCWNRCGCVVDLLFTCDREVDREEDEEREREEAVVYIYNRTKSKLYESVPYRLSP